MKIKKIYPFILILLSTIFITNSSAKKIQNKDFEKPKTDVERFLGLDQITPSQMSTLSIKYYFQDLKNQILFNGNQSQAAKKSRTTIFNQSLTNYVKEIYNSNYYANLLSSNGSHIVEFIELGSELNLEAQSLYTGLRLFYNKIKSCELIDDSVIIQILEPMPKLLEKYFEVEEYKAPSLDTLSKNMEKELLFKFTEHLDLFHSEPNDFIKELSDTIGKLAKEELDILQKAAEEKEITERLRQITIRFFEIALSKTIWDENSPEGIWDSVNTIANGLQLLGIHGIVDHMDDLDDMLWSLTYRFSWFLDLIGSKLPLEFYEEIEFDLESKVIFFLESQEQDEGIKTKKEVIAEAVLKAKAKAIAFEEQGIFTDQILDY